ncbi:MAG: response regulator transcription factor [Rhodospirillales bacterium]|nr:response regulator transcription factor [Rhodospirillales bacterium]
MMTVMIADGHPLFREALCEVIRSMDADHRIYEASTLEQARQLAAAGGPSGAWGDTRLALDIILLELRLPGSVGFSAIAELRNAASDVPIVVVSAATARPIVRNSISYGASGFIPKSFSASEISAAVRRVLNGELFLPNEAITGSLSGHDPPGNLHDRVATLTPRQLKGFGLVAKGKSNKEIASTSASRYQR